jgi:hypothetical protein
MGRRCSYDECFSDDECGDFVCRCREHAASANICLRQGNCGVDADCGRGGFCSPSFGNCGNYNGVIGYFCHTPTDGCTDDSDCAGEWEPYCMWNSVAGRWTCSDSHCLG